MFLVCYTSVKVSIQRPHFSKQKRGCLKELPVETASDYQIVKDFR